MIDISHYCDKPVKQNSGIIFIWSTKWLSLQYIVQSLVVLLKELIHNSHPRRISCNYYDVCVELISGFLDTLHIFVYRIETKRLQQRILAILDKEIEWGSWQRNNEEIDSCGFPWGFVTLLAAPGVFPLSCHAIFLTLVMANIWG